MAKPPKTKRPLRESGGAYKPPPKKKPKPGAPYKGPPLGSINFPTLPGDFELPPLPQGQLVPTTPGDAVGSILQSDPGYQAWLGQLQAESIADRESRNAAIRRAIIMYGGVPNLPPGFLAGLDQTDLQAILDENTRSLAAQNTQAGLSTLARLMEAAKMGQKRVVDNTAARGMFRSGETGYGMKQVQTADARNRYDSANQLLDYLAGVQAAFVKNERERKRAELEASGKVIEGYNPPPNPEPFIPPPPPPPGPPVNDTGRPFRESGGPRKKPPKKKILRPGDYGYRPF